MDYQGFADKILDVLRRNREWQERYKDYLKNIENKRERSEEDLLKRFYVKAPLYQYTTIGNEKNNTSILQTIIRYKGQEVAKVVQTKGDVYLRIDSTIAKNNGQFFISGQNSGQSKIITTMNGQGVKWDSSEGMEFRRFFNSLPSKKNNNGEHTLESLLLTELEKTKAKGKSLCNIQPVKINGKRFQMKTPLSGSKIHTMKDFQSIYSGVFGGGIDILARRRLNGNHLAVIELKDENKPSEKPEAAIKQSIAYAIFIRELLRCGIAGGDGWYRLFGFNRPIPEKLTIKCVIAMPDIANLELFKGNDIYIDKDVLELHCISINKTSGKIIGCSEGF